MIAAAWKRAKEILSQSFWRGLIVFLLYVIPIALQLVISHFILLPYHMAGTLAAIPLKVDLVLVFVQSMQFIFTLGVIDFTAHRVLGYNVKLAILFSWFSDGKKIKKLVPYFLLGLGTQTFFVLLDRFFAQQLPASVQVYMLYVPLVIQIVVQFMLVSLQFVLVLRRDIPFFKAVRIAVALTIKNARLILLYYIAQILIGVASAAVFVFMSAIPFLYIFCWLFFMPLVLMLFFQASFYILLLQRGGLLSEQDSVPTNL